jgi:hypothetical protein
MTSDDYPPDYEPFVIDSVEHGPEAIVVRYGGRAFGGIVRESLLGTNLEAAIRPGAEILVRYYPSETSVRGQVAHMLIYRVETGEWAEIYRDFEVA